MKKLICLIAVCFLLIGANVYGNDINNNDGYVMLAKHFTNVDNNVEFVLSYSNVELAVINYNLNEVTLNFPDKMVVNVPEPEFGTVGNKYFTGIVLLNNTAKSQYGVLKIGTRFYDVCVNQNSALTFSLETLIGHDNRNVPITLYSEHLYLKTLVLVK